ncbi:cyclic nucleotide-binding domain-containing protein 1 [Ochotona curzoniae]|uniref:cyclic nucleotide-binding domain-containing protein 1 n=1 Tax=Ochotona curzoniae TaxID=130825 RepID=UPI001B34A3E2|nr:cyclic nucleotide-binding domain-containing protein 1 [Ochotona curzoniae]
MPMSTLPASILSHMIAINNVPPPPLRSIPSLKVSKHINYGQLNALCHIRGLHHSHSSCNIVSAHNTFMKQYPEIFLHKKPILPKISKQIRQRKPREKAEDSLYQHPDDFHNIAVHIKKARGGQDLRGSQVTPEKIAEFLAILKKLPVHRTAQEHNIVWKMLRTIPELNSNLSKEHLKIVSRNLVSQTWIKGSTVTASDGFYIILKGVARYQPKVWNGLNEKMDSAVSYNPLTSSSLAMLENFRSSDVSDVYARSPDSKLGQWSTFGSLDLELETQPFSVVTEEECEILKISAKEYEKLKMEKIKQDNIQKFKLIHNCPYYEEWPTLSINELVMLIKWKKFPPGHVIVESGDVISFVAFINSGYCNIYRSIIGLVKLQTNKVKKSPKLVYMGRLKEKESFGEISVLLQEPFPCTIITGKEVEMAIIEDKDIFELDEVTKQLMLYTAKPTFGHLTEEDVKLKYMERELRKEWKQFKDKTLSNTLFYNGILPGFGKWMHDWKSIPRNLKDTLFSY